MIKRFTQSIKQFWSDDRGAEGIEKLLLLGLLIIPLVAILIWFKDDITEWVQGIWGEVQDDNDDYRFDG